MYDESLVMFFDLPFRFMLRFEESNIKCIPLDIYYKDIYLVKSSKYLRIVIQLNMVEACSTYLK